ncbi:hypothetical protein JR316_0000759 [Psilocybe cubensis]|uniref:Uncharacterized protein n=1 Tax=Psilocybe cubensis TaxID=181762 RepID=A0ACB8HHP4_PSICU|nr:hypothetical protein JR316_0000759 [Psilocybe cubensis]KAH9486694.1 hypothetical protein JR316_0000759 [Psilocybe cubensis]
MPAGRTVKIAVIGTGLAGLTAAHLLAKESQGDGVDFEVHLFEKASGLIPSVLYTSFTVCFQSSAIGMDSASISLTGNNTASEDDWRVDVPMRSFQGEKAGQDRTIITTMIYNGGSGRAGVSKPSSLGNVDADKQVTSFQNPLRNIWATGLFLLYTLQLIICYAITLYHSLPLWRSSDISTMTFRDWASRSTPHRFIFKRIGLDLMWIDYVHSTLIPLFSAVCTAPAEDILNHPVEEFLDYIWLTLGTHHYVVVGGVRDVVSRLTAGIRHLHLSSPIMSIQSDRDDPHFNEETTEYNGFHHVILATQASGAVPILSNYLQSMPAQSSHRDDVERQINCLKAFDYRKSIVVNHTDDTLLPDNSADVRDLNLISHPFHSSSRFYEMQNSKAFGTLCVSPSYTMATHVLSTPKEYPHTAPRVYQTTNPIIAPKEESILSVSKLDRAIVTRRSKAALQSLCVQESKKWWQCSYESRTRLGELQGNSTVLKGYNPGIWICGSYAHLGIPLLEGCVVSARNVVEGILAKEGAVWKGKPW